MKIIAVILSCLSATIVSAQSYFTDNGILYKEILTDPSKMQVKVCIKDDEGNPIDRYFNCYSGKISIPASVEHDLDHYEVTKLQSFVFNGCDELEELSFGENMSEVPDYTIVNCAELESLSFSGLVKIGNSSITCLPKLTVLDLGPALTKIGEGSFVNLPELREIKLPSGVKKLGKDSFVLLPSLEKINLGLIKSFTRQFSNCNLKDIDLSSAEKITTSFNDLPHLKSVTFGKNLKTITGSFRNTTLKTIYLSGTSIESIESSFNNTIDNIVLPATIKKIESSISKYNGTSIDLPSGLQSIKESFQDTPYITELKLPEGIESITESFIDMPNVEHLILPQSLINLIDEEDRFKRYSFRELPKLKRIVFGKNLKSYPDGSYKSLEEVWFDNPEPIGECPKWLMYRKGIKIHVPKGSKDAYLNAWELKSNFISPDDFSIIEDTYPR